MEKRANNFNRNQSLNQDIIYKEYAKLREEYELLQSKLDKLEKAQIIETDVSEIFKIEKQIEKIKPNLEQIKEKIEFIENIWSKNPLSPEDVETENSVEDNYFDKFKNIFEDYTEYDLDSFIALDFSTEQDKKENLINYVQNWLKKDDDPNLLLLGEYGCGKTFFSKYLVQNYSKEPSQYRIPILIETKNLKYSDIQREIPNILKNWHDINITWRQFQKLLKAGKLFLVFDGLDEISLRDQNDLSNKFEWINELVHHKNKLLLTSRKQYFRFSYELNTIIENYSFNILEIEKFDGSSIQLYLKKKFGDTNGTLIFNKIHENETLKKLITRPIYLFFLTRLHLDEIKQIAESRVHFSLIHENYIRFILNQKKLSISQRIIINLMLECAFSMYGRNTYNITREDLSTISSSLNINKDQFEEIFSKMFLETKDNENFTFIHKSIMEYFVAKKLVGDIQTNNVKNLACRRIHYEVSEFVAGLLDEDDINTLFTFFQKSFNEKEAYPAILFTNAVDIFSEVEDKDLRRLIEEKYEMFIQNLKLEKIKNWTIRNIHVALFAAFIGDKELLEELLQNLKDKKITEEQILERYYVTANNFEYYENNVELLTHEFIAILKMKDKFKYFRSFVCYVLGILRRTSATQTLIDILFDESEPAEIKREAKEALHKIQNPTDEGKIGIYFYSDNSKLVGTLYIAKGNFPKPTAIILHGIPGIEQNYDLAFSLRKNGWNSLVFHYRGCWGSEGNYTLKTIPTDVKNALDFLCNGKYAKQINPDKLVLIGHSLGGWAATLTASKYFHPKAIAVYGAVADPKGLPFTKSDAESDFTPWLSGMNPEQFVVQWESLGDDFRPSKEISKITSVPILILHGKSDVVVPYTQAQALYENANEPKEICLFPNANHSFSWHREELIQYIINWLNKLKI